MTEGIDIVVQIRAPDPNTYEDVPAYYTAECTISESSLDQFDSRKVVEDVMRNAVREVVAEWKVDTNE